MTVGHDSENFPAETLCLCSSLWRPPKNIRTHAYILQIYTHRIKYFTREIVVFRYDALKAMRRRCLVPCEGKTACIDGCFAGIVLPTPG